MSSEVKKDAGKLRYDLIPYASLDEVVKVLTLGNKKYPEPEQNWLVNSAPSDVARYEAAIMRHMSAVFQGEEFDPEMGTDHLAHVACNCLFIMAIKAKWHQVNVNSNNGIAMSDEDYELLKADGWINEDRTTQDKG